MATFVLPFRRNVGYLRLSGGSSLDSDLPLYDTFTLGGPVSLPGLSIGELRGTSYWSAQASYLQRIADISYIFGQSIYAGLTPDRRRHERSHRPGACGTHVFRGASCWPAGRRSDRCRCRSRAPRKATGNWYSSLGRPIEERAITDPTW